MKPDQLDVARLRKAFASVGGEGTHGVDSAGIFDAVHGDLSVADRRALVDKLTADADAAETWRLARELAPERYARPRAFSAPRGSWASLAAAAALVAVTGWLARPRPIDEPTYRGSTAHSIASALPPGAGITRTTPTLRWTGVEGGRYRVRVLSADLTMIAQSDELRLTEYTLEPSALGQIPVGAHILWQVTARIPTEGIVESPTFHTRLE